MALRLAVFNVGLAVAFASFGGWMWPNLVLAGIFLAQSCRELEGS